VLVANDMDIVSSIGGEIDEDGIELDVVAVMVDDSAVGGSNSAISAAFDELQPQIWRNFSKSF
jgi:hypothetical protein